MDKGKTMKISKKLKYELLGNSGSTCRIINKSKEKDEIKVSIYSPTSWDPMPFSRTLTLSYAEFKRHFRVI